MFRVARPFAVWIAIVVAAPACVDLSQPGSLGRVASGGVDGGVRTDGAGDASASATDTGRPDIDEDAGGVGLTVDAGAAGTGGRGGAGGATAPDAGTGGRGGAGGTTPDAAAPDARTPDAAPPDARSSLQNGLIGYWTFDEGSGAVARDSSATGGSAMLVSSPAWLTSGLPAAVTFPDPAAVSFNGVNQYATVDSAALKPSRFTVAAWVRFTSLSNAGRCGAGVTPAEQYIVEKQNIYGGEGYVLYKSTNLLFLVTDATSKSVYVTSTTVPQAGIWYHVAGSYDGTTIRIHVDGKKERETPVPGIVGYNTAPLYIGRSGECKSQGLGTFDYDAFFNGAIDDLRIYDRALSDAEIAALAAGQR